MRRRQQEWDTECSDCVDKNVELAAKNADIERLRSALLEAENEADGRLRQLTTQTKWDMDAERKWKAELAESKAEVERLHECLRFESEAHVLERANLRAEHKQDHDLCGVLNESCNRLRAIETAVDGLKVVAIDIETHVVEVQLPSANYSVKFGDTLGDILRRIQE